MTARIVPVLALGLCVLAAPLAYAAPNPEAPKPDDNTAAPAPAPEPGPGDEPETAPAAAPAPASATGPAPAAAPAPGPAPQPPYGWQAQWAPQAVAPVDQAPDKPLPPAGPPRWQAWLGARNTFVTSTGYDPFATDNALVQFSVGGSRSLFSHGHLSFAVGATFDAGTSTASARGAPTTLETYRVLAAPEARWILIPQLYLFARPAVGAVRTAVSLDEGTSGVTLHSRAWRVAVDLDAGAAFAFADLRGKAGQLRFWVIADGGYAWTQAQQLSMAPDADSGAPVRTASLDLGTLRLGGPYFRGAVAATF